MTTLSPSDLGELKRKLIEGGDVEDSNEHGETQLYRAAVTGDLPLVKLLIEHGADVNAWPSLSGGGPLHGVVSQDPGIL